MSVPTIQIEDPDRGLPRQPVPLRFASLVVGWGSRGFLALFHSNQVEDPGLLLQGYEYSDDNPPREVRRDFYAELARKILPDATEADALKMLPADHFVWSDDLATVFSAFVDEFHDREDAYQQGIGLGWHPALGYVYMLWDSVTICNI